MSSAARPTLITGGGGILAQALRRAIPARDSSAHIIALDRQSLDITDERQLEQWFHQNRPAIVINCAAYTKVDQAEIEREQADAINGHAVGKLAGLCRAYDALLVHFSTDYVFDGTLRRPLRPDDPIGPQSAYGASKLLGEQLLQKNASENWLLIRTAWLYGPGGPSFPRTMLDAAGAGKPLRVVNDQIGAPTFTFDLAEATLDLLERGASGIYHLTNAGQTSWFDFARAIFEAFELPPDLQPLTSSQWKAQRPQSATRPAYSVLDLSKFEQTTGRSMRHWRDALREFKVVSQRRG